MGKVVSGNAVRFQQYLIHIVFRNRQLTLHKIVIFELVADVAGGTEPENPGLPGINLCLNILHGTVTPDGVLSVVACGFLVLLLLFPHGRELFLRAEAGVGLPLGDKLLGIDMINVSPLTLAVGAVCAVVAVHGGTLIKVNAIMLQCVDEHFHSPGDFPFGVGILNTKKQHTAGLVGHPFTGQSLNQITQVDKSGGGWSHPGDDGAFRKITGREPLFKILR